MIGNEITASSRPLLHQHVVARDVGYIRVLSNDMSDCKAHVLADCSSKDTQKHPKASSEMEMMEM